MRDRYQFMLLWKILTFAIIFFGFLFIFFPFRQEIDPSKKHVGVIGAGFSGLASACYLRAKGYQVTVIEKNERPGGRANVLYSDGFRFDMGPSWFWMKDLFDDFFDDFNYKPAYTLERLDPSYTIYWDRENGSETTELWDNIAKRKLYFENREPGSSKMVDAMLLESKWKYDVAMKNYVARPGVSFLEMWDVPFRVPHLLFEFLISQRKYAASFVKDDRLRTILEWPVIFLGGAPANIPKLYSLMTWTEWGGGTWYPKPGGMYAIVEAIYHLAMSIGVEFEFNHPVEKLNINDEGLITSIESATKKWKFDAIVASADYHFVEQILLPSKYRRYSEAYWNSREFAPATYLYYIGFNRTIPGLSVHTYFFHDGFDTHLENVFLHKKWPKDPVFYVNAPSKIDPDVAPKGGESIMILLPLSVDLWKEDTEEKREYWLNFCLDRMSTILSVNLRESVVVLKTFGHTDFQSMYNGYKGNSFGLANTLFQTWLLKPQMKSLVKNMVFVGQLTAPGPGVPPSLISGRMGATLIDDWFHYDEDHYLFSFVFAFTIGFILVSWLSEYFHQGETRSLDECYEIARKLHMSHGLSCYVSSLLLPADSQKHVFALYGITRTADEIVDDGTRTEIEATEQLNALKIDFFECFHHTGDKKDGHPVNRAAAETAKLLGLKKEMFERFFHSMAMDIPRPLQIENWQELVTYMNGSAAVIGEFMLPVLIDKHFYTNPERFPEYKELIQTARALGNAFQLTNFCRDIDEDLGLQRTYLPSDGLTKFGVTQEMLDNRKITPQFAEAIEYYLNICDGWYEDAMKGIVIMARYNPISADCIQASHKLYSGISQEIRKQNYDVFTQRCRVSMSRKLGVLGKHLNVWIIIDIAEVLFHHLQIKWGLRKPIAPPPVIVRS